MITSSEVRRSVGLWQWIRRDQVRQQDSGDLYGRWAVASQGGSRVPSPRRQVEDLLGQGYELPLFLEAEMLWLDCAVAAPASSGWHRLAVGCAGKQSASQGDQGDDAVLTGRCFGPLHAGSGERFGRKIDRERRFVDLAYQ